MHLYLQYRNKLITYDDYKGLRNSLNAQIQTIIPNYWENEKMSMEYAEKAEKPINECVQ